MNRDDWLTEHIEANRTRPPAAAYRTLGSGAEASDAVKETWVRLTRADATSFANLGGWLTTVAGRVCLDRLSSSCARREAPTGVRPADQGRVAEDSDPEQQAIVAESVGSALLVRTGTYARV
jgi:DNA-directed RNA polymerase specialized sigma24 family protein